MAAVLQHKLAQTQYCREALGVSAELLDWSSDARHEESYTYTWEQQSLKLTLAIVDCDEYRTILGDVQATVSVVNMGDNTAHLLVNNRHYHVAYQAQDGATLHLATESATVSLTNAAALPPDSQEQAGSGSVVAPMHGQLLSILVEQGQMVAKGDRLAVLEAMKMQHELVAQVDGVVGSVWAKAGTQLAAGDRILMVEPEAEC